MILPRDAWHSNQIEQLPERLLNKKIIFWADTDFYAVNKMPKVRSLSS